MNHVSLSHVIYDVIDTRHVAPAAAATMLRTVYVQGAPDGGGRACRGGGSAGKVGEGVGKACMAVDWRWRRLRSPGAGSEMLGGRGRGPVWRRTVHGPRGPAWAGGGGGRRGTERPSWRLCGKVCVGVVGGALTTLPTPPSPRRPIVQDPQDAPRQARPRGPRAQGD